MYMASESYTELNKHTQQAGDITCYLFSDHDMYLEYTRLNSLELSIPIHSRNRR